MQKPAQSSWRQIGQQLVGDRSRLRFIVLASERSGSNHFVGLIRQHPCIQCFYELLNDNPSARSRWRGERYRGEPEVEQWIEQVYEYPYRFYTSAVGFKLFYSQGREESIAAIWQHLQSMPQLRVIELVRENRFEQFVSLVLARQNNQWHEYRHYPERSYEPVEIAPESFLEYLKIYESFRVKAHDRLKDKVRLNVTYEQLLERRQETLERVFAFLDVPTTPFKYLWRSPFRKQRKVPTNQQVKNYQELRRYFADTPQAEYFNDGV